MLILRRRGFGVSHTYHLLGYLIRFLLIDIPWLVYLQFRLQRCVWVG